MNLVVPKKEGYVGITMISGVWLGRRAAMM